MTDNSIAPLHGLILTGGKSKRMGRDKNLLDYHGLPQWKFALRLLEEFLPKVHLSSREGQDYEHPHIIYDIEEGLGPFGAILSAFNSYPNTAFLVIANDLPFIDEKKFAKLIQERDPSKAATAFKVKEKDYPEPLAAIWEPQAYTFIQDFYQKKCFKPIDVLREMEIKEIQISAKHIENINTKEAYKKALDKFKKL